MFGRQFTLGILEKYNSWIWVDGPVDPNSTTTLQLVDAYSTLVDDLGRHVTILWLNQALHCASLEQFLMAEDQLEYNGVKVNSHAKLSNEKQCIIAKNPMPAKPFTINLGWDGSSKFFDSRPD